MAALTKSEVKERALARDQKIAADRKARPSALGGTLADTGDHIVGMGAGLANWGKKKLTGTSSDTLAGLRQKGVAAEQSMYADTLAGGGLGWATVYDVARRTPEEIALYLASMKAVQGVAAVGRFARGLYLAKQAQGATTEAARLAELAIKHQANPIVAEALKQKAAKLAGDAAKASAKVEEMKLADTLRSVGITGKEAAAAKAAGTAASTTAGVAGAPAAGATKGLAGTAAKAVAAMKEHPWKTAAGALATGAVVVGGVSTAVKAGKDEKKNPLAGPDANKTTEKPRGLQGDIKNSTGTIDDFVRSSLSAAGFSPQQMAAASNYNHPYLSVLGGNQPRYNPMFRGQVPLAGDVMRRHTGTHQEQAAALKDDQDFNERVWQSMAAAAQQGTEAYGRDRATEATTGLALRKMQPTPKDAFNNQARLFTSELIAQQKLLNDPDADPVAKQLAGKALPETRAKFAALMQEAEQSNVVLGSEEEGGLYGNV